MVIWFPICIYWYIFYFVFTCDNIPFRIKFIHWNTKVSNFQLYWLSTISCFSNPHEEWVFINWDLLEFYKVIAFCDLRLLIPMLLIFFFCDLCLLISMSLCYTTVTLGWRTNKTKGNFQTPWNTSQQHPLTLIGILSNSECKLSYCVFVCCFLLGLFIQCCSFLERSPTSDNLVPIRLDIEIDGQRFKDAFTWNPCGMQFLSQPPNLSSVSCFFPYSYF